MITLLRFVTSLLGLLAFASMPTFGAVLQFEAVPSNADFYYGPDFSYSESGYALQNLTPSYWVIASPIATFGFMAGPASTSDFFAAEWTTHVIFGEQHNSTFSLNSIDVGIGQSDIDPFKAPLTARRYLIIAIR